jgi:hypothetical protein
MQVAIAGVVGQRLREVVEVAVEVDVLVRGAADVREAVRVQRMHVHDGHPALARPRAPARVAQGRHLHAAAAIAFDAVAAAREQQDRGRVRMPVAHHVHGEFLAVAPAFGMPLALDREPGGLRGFQELLTGFAVRCREGVLPCCGHALSRASQASARRTQ